MATATATLRFPSVDWFKELQSRFNAETDKARQSGQADTTMAIVCGDEAVQLTFLAYQITDVRQISTSELNQVDFYLEQPAQAWREMLENIKEHHRAEGRFTLNSLDGADPDGFARSKAGYMDGDARDAFYRFNQTFQDLFDLSARIDTSF